MFVVEEEEVGSEGVLCFEREGGARELPYLCDVDKAEALTDESGWYFSRKTRKKTIVIF